MRRGDVVIATGPGFGEKAATLRGDPGRRLRRAPTAILLPIATELADPPSALRVALVPDAANGLFQPSEVMTDIPVTTKADRVHQHIGRLAQADVARLERALGLVLGFAG